MEGKSTAMDWMYEKGGWNFFCEMFSPACKRYQKGRGRVSRTRMGIFRRRAMGDSRRGSLLHFWTDRLSMRLCFSDHGFQVVSMLVRLYNTRGFPSSSYIYPSSLTHAILDTVPPEHLFDSWVMLKGLPASFSSGARAVPHPSNKEDGRIISKSARFSGRFEIFPTFTMDPAPLLFFLPRRASMQRPVRSQRILLVLSYRFFFFSWPDEQDSRDLAFAVLPWCCKQASKD